jgi:excisionase family DNA binding protein
MAAYHLEENKSMEDWLTPEEAAKILRVSKDTIIRQCEKHHLPAVKLGSIWRISFRGLQIQAEKNLNDGDVSIVDKGGNIIQ